LTVVPKVEILASGVEAITNVESYYCKGQQFLLQAESE
jgi:hypothetical protein